MNVIVEPEAHIAKVWGTLFVKPGETYRMMRYVLRVDYQDHILLCNTVTGELVSLETEEIFLINKLPSAYTPVMTRLINNHFVVPENYDEFSQVLKLRKILHALSISDSISKDITNYTILPTTSCNARCYYCYEKGIQSVTMTDETVENTIRFIVNHCNTNKKVRIRWFGGEPTVAAYRIDQICKGLRKNNVDYSSTMTTNGYLFDKEMIIKARTLWNLKNVMISVDGTEKNYNSIKSYVNVRDNPYQRVLRNIGLLLDQGIKVGLRMNFDIGNYQDFEKLLIEAIERFKGNTLLQVYAFPVKGEYQSKDGEIHHGSDDWFDQKIAELNDTARNAGLFNREIPLPSLFFTTCKAGDPSSMIITAQGELARCTSIFFEQDQIIGTVKDGILNTGFQHSFSQFAQPIHCINCVFFPSCVLISKCPGKGECFYTETFRQHEEAVINAFNMIHNTV